MQRDGGGLPKLDQTAFNVMVDGYMYGLVAISRTGRGYLRISLGQRLLARNLRTLAAISQE